MAGLPKVVAGDDYRNVIWFEEHVHCLTGYWNTGLKDTPKNGDTALQKL